MIPLILVRKAFPAEASDVAAIGYSAWETGILPLLSEIGDIRQVEKQRLCRAARENIDNIIVAEVDGVVVGWCARAARCSYISYLFVLPQLQSHGVGALLLRRMESLLELEGAARVHLETPADNVRAVHFYERQGYHILAMRPDGKNHHAPLVSVRLEKLLHPYEGAIGDIE